MDLDHTIFVMDHLKVQQDHPVRFRIPRVCCYCSTHYGWMIADTPGGVTHGICPLCMFIYYCAGGDKFRHLEILNNLGVIHGQE